MNRFFPIGITFITICAIVTACVTTKKKGDVPWLKRNYHSMTTKYNYYYNANVLYEEGISKLNQRHQDNYNQVLEMYPYSAIADTSIVAADMNTTIQKLTTAAAIHRFGYWVDDCALLLGKSQYLKRDFEGAEETFAYLTDEFKPGKVRKTEKERKKESNKKKIESKKKIENKKKEAEKNKKEAAAKKKADAKAREKARAEAKKKGEKYVPPIKSTPTEDKKEEKKEKDNKQTDAKEKKKKSGYEEFVYDPFNGDKTKPKSYFLKNRPSYQEGLAWLARTYTERQNYAEAEDILSQLLRNKSTFKDVRRLAAQFYAYNLLKQKEYSKAVKPLEYAINLTKSKREKARFWFILGQIQEKLQHDAEALNAYDRVLAYKNIPYDMEFSARMNVALYAYTKGAGSADGAIRSLEKMAKEAKNAEYRDQIYFALAQISIKTNDRKSAITYLQKSLQNSKANQNQKAESYITMASLYFNEEDYVRAKHYYDSTITVLPKNDERYEDAKRLAFGLNDITKHIKIIQVQDSLLRIAAMTPEQQRAFCLRLKVRDIEVIEKAEAAATEAAKSSSPQNNIDIQYPPGVTPSTFFAYNFKGIQQGRREFEKKWGRDRKLTDDWRRSSRKPGSNENTLADNNDTEQKVKRDKSKVTDDEFRKMMANVPSMPQQIEAANLAISESMLKLGIAYRETLQRNDKCISTLEALNTKYPDSKYEPEALYQLYQAYTNTNNTPKAKVCYDQLLSKYPNTTYARILADPEYVQSMKRRGQELDDYYKNTYTAFTKGNYKEAYDRSVSADTVFKAKNIYKPKFALLAAMSLGNIAGKEKYITAIKDVIAKFPETPEQKRAKEILRLLIGAESAAAETGDASLDFGPYKNEDDAVHYIVVILKDKNARVEEAKAKIADFNRDNYKSRNLKISNVFFGENSEIPMLVIRKFDDKADGLKYTNHVNQVRDAFMTEKANFDVFAISQSNYKELLKDKSTDKYKVFYNATYAGR